MVRSFIKKTTNVGGTTGVIIPKEVLYAEGIKRGDHVRIIIESLSEGDSAAAVARKMSPPLLEHPWASTPVESPLMLSERLITSAVYCHQEGFICRSVQEAS